MQKTKQPSAHPAEQRIILHGISWETHESLLADHEDKSSPRFAYDKGALEIMSPSPARERANRDLAMLVEVIFEEWGVDIANFGSTIYKREDIERGFEPDSCFYIENEPLARDKDRLDLDEDPPPDLVTEIDVTSFSLDKLPLYVSIGVPEVWRCEDAKLEILLLDGDSCRKFIESKCLPGIQSTTLTNLMRKRKTLGRIEWLKKIREAARKKAR
ncbi:MAG: Uma2 family endonuclease [Rubrobacteraceae bacterium]